MREFLAIAASDSGVPIQRIAASAAHVARQLFVKRWNLSHEDALEVAIVDVVASGMGELPVQCRPLSAVDFTGYGYKCEGCQPAPINPEGWREVDGVTLPPITWGTPA
jgi:hypothetical protein